MKIVECYVRYLPILRKTRLLQNIPLDEYESVFRYLNASVVMYEHGEVIQRLGRPFQYAMIVLDGSLQGTFMYESYEQLEVDVLETGRSFGEALSYIHTPHSPIQLEALTDCTVLLLDLSLINMSEDTTFVYRQVLSLNLLSLMASQHVYSTLKLRIMSQKSLRERILIYLHSLIPDAEGYVYIPFTQTALAEFLGVNRSALSREFGNMQDEKLFTMIGKKIKLREHN